jgi:ribonuclease D
LAVLQVLSSWREDVAITENRPRRWVIGDAILVELAKQQPTDSVSLEALASSMSAEKSTQRYESALLRAITEGRGVAEADWPQAKSRSDYTPAQLAEIKAFMSLVKVKADACQLTSSLISTRKDIENIVSGGRDNRLLDGWRYKIVGVELLNILNENKRLKESESAVSDNK